MDRLNKAVFLQMYEKMVLTRRFEENVSRMITLGMVHGTTHLYIGEEAISAGVCTAMAKDDLMVSTHRGHGHNICRGLDLKRMMAELLGKETGFCKGKGGSMHIADLTSGVLGANGVVGGGLPLAVGAGLTIKLKKYDRAVVCFFGDGASNQGSFHESLNLASVWDLPILFVCENNQYGMSTSVRESMKIDDISKRAISYGIAGRRIDGNDVFSVYNNACEDIAYVKKNGPMLLVCETYRYMGHSKSDANVYRTKEEIEMWKAKDPIIRNKKYLLDNAICSEAEITEVEQKVERELAEAVEFAEKSSFPSSDSIFEDVCG